VQLDALSSLPSLPHLRRDSSPFSQLSSTSLITEDTAMASTNAPMDEKPRMEKRTSDADSESVHSEKTKVEVPVLKYDERHW
jgi:hypothetical protein